jgi:hypothetical protein
MARSMGRRMASSGASSPSPLAVRTQRNSGGPSVSASGHMPGRTRCRHSSDCSTSPAISRAPAPQTVSHSLPSFPSRYAVAGGARPRAASCSKTLRSRGSARDRSWCETACCHRSQVVQAPSVANAIATIAMPVTATIATRTTVRSRAVTARSRRGIHLEPSFLAIVNRGSARLAFRFPTICWHP